MTQNKNKNIIYVEAKNFYGYSMPIFILTDLPKWIAPSRVIQINTAAIIGFPSRS